MNDWNVKIHEYDSKQCGEILSQLPGIFSAKLRFEDDQLVEIHALASTERNPKQIVRDIQSALFAAYGLEVDHRIISIAQLPSDPFSDAVAPAAPAPAPARNVRLQFSGIDSTQNNGSYQVSIHVTCDGQVFSGTERCRDTLAHRNRAIARATVKAVNAFLGKDYFSLLEVKQINVWDVVVAVTVLEYQEKDASEPVLLIGAAAQRDNSASDIVRSTLDGLNRSVSKLCSCVNIQN